MVRVERAASLLGEAETGSIGAGTGAEAAGSPSFA
jgi:L-aminopeptidase/D-esterase-like protein